MTAFFGRRIAHTLSGPATVEVEATRLTPTADLRETTELVLRARAGHATGDAGLLFAPADNTTCWHFYERRYFDLATRRWDLMYLGRVLSSMAPRTLVTFAYSLILERSPDEGGLQHYVKLLAQDSGTYRLLDILASSREAKALNRFLVIVPAPSRFIPQTLMSEPDMMDGVVAVLAEPDSKEIRVA